MQFGWRSRFLRARSYRIVVRGSAWRAAIWTSRRSSPASSMVVTKVWRSMCGCALGIRIPAVTASRRAPGGRVAVHPGAAAVEQDRAAGAGIDRFADRAPGGGRQRDQDDLGAFAAHAQHPVAVIFAEAGDAGAGSFEDPQAGRTGHGYQREVARVR